MKKLLSLISALTLALAILCLCTGCDTAGNENSGSLQRPSDLIKNAIDKVYNDLLDSSQGWLLTANQDDLQKIYGLKPEMYDAEYALHTMLINQATRLIGVRVVAGQEAQVKAALQSVLDKMSTSFGNYPAQAAIAKSGKLLQYTQGGATYMFLLICDKTDQAVSIVNGYFPSSSVNS